MIKNLVHDPIFLAGKSEAVTKEDLQVAQDLLDTLIANTDACAGMAANVGGVRKRIIVFDMKVHISCYLFRVIDKHQNELVEQEMG